MTTCNSRFAHRITSTLVCALVLGGCSLGNPYVVRTSDEARGKLCEIHDECTVAEGSRYAYSLASRYREKLSQHAQMESSVGAGGIILGSIVLALAASDVHADAFKAVGVLGASGYGLNTWYSNKPREEIYAKGMVALSCAVSAAHPLALPASEREKLRSFRARAGLKIDNVGAAAANLRSIASTGAGSPTQQAMVATLLKAARDEIDRAAASAESAAILDSLASAAGNELVKSVDSIETAVDDALRKTVPEGTLALQIAGSLGGLAAKVVPGLKLTMGMPAASEDIASSQSKDETPVAPYDSVIETRADALRVALAALRMEHAPVLGVLAAFSGTGVATRLEACAALGLSALSVTPNQIEFTQGTAASASAVIDHGKPPYSATTLGPASKGIEIKNPLPFDRRLDIAISAETQANRYPILVSDANGRTTQLTLTVSPPPTPVPPKGGEQGASNGEKNPATPMTVSQLMEALKSWHGKKIGGGKYEIASFTQSGKALILRLKDDPKLSDSAERASLSAELEGMSLSDQPLDKRLKALGMTLELPK